MLQFLLTANVFVALTLCVGAFIAIVVTKVMRIFGMSKRILIHPARMAEAIKQDIEQVEEIRHGRAPAVLVTAYLRRLGWSWGLFVIGFVWLLLTFFIGACFVGIGVFK